MFSLDLPASKGGISTAVRWKLMDRLYAPNRMAVLDAVQIAAAGLLLWQRTHLLWLLGWTLASLALLVASVLIARSYRRCNEDDDPQVWTWRFILAAWNASLLWGALSIFLFLTPDPVVHLIVIGGQWCHVSTILTRNSSEPRAAFGQICLVELPLVLSCLATENVTYMLYGLSVTVGILIARSTIRSLCAQTVELLNANEELAASRDELEQANQQLEALATTDALTSMVNRRGFDVAYRREWRRALRGFQPLSLLVLDLDLFKKLNDALGHQAGDACLRRVADCIQSNVRRPADVATRYGGEEFAIVLPDTDPIAARHLAERVRAAIAKLGIPHPANPEQVVTVSIGAATTTPDETLTPSLLFEQADAALYRAKAMGRNRTITCELLPTGAASVAQMAAAETATVIANFRAS